MARDTVRIQLLTRVPTLADGDVLPTGPESGDVAKGITFLNLKNQIESSDSEKIVPIAGTYTLLADDNHLFATADTTVTMIDASLFTHSLTIRADSGVTVTLIGATFGASVTPITSNQSITIIPVLGSYEYTG